MATRNVIKKLRESIYKNWAAQPGVAAEGIYINRGWGTQFDLSYFAVASDGIWFEFELTQTQARLKSNAFESELKSTTQIEGQTQKLNSKLKCANSKLKSLNSIQLDKKQVFIVCECGECMVKEPRSNLGTQCKKCKDKKGNDKRYAQRAEKN